MTTQEHPSGHVQFEFEQKELRLLCECLKSGYAELISLYGKEKEIANHSRMVDELTTIRNLHINLNKFIKPVKRY